MKAQLLQAALIATPLADAHSTGRTCNAASQRERPLHVVDARINAQNRRTAMRAAIARWRSFGGTLARLTPW